MVRPWPGGAGKLVVSSLGSRPGSQRKTRLLNDMKPSPTARVLDSPQGPAARGAVAVVDEEHPPGHRFGVGNGARGLEPTAAFGAHLADCGHDRTRGPGVLDALLA